MAKVNIRERGKTPITPQKRRAIKPKLEKNFEKQAVELLRNACLASFKMRSSVNGLPDRIVLGPGRTCFFIEFKRQKTGRAEPLQLILQKLLNEFGFGAYFCRTIDEVKAAIKNEIEQHKVTTVSA